MTKRILSVLVFILVAQSGYTLSSVDALIIDCDNPRINVEKMICMDDALKDKHNALISLYKVREHSKTKSFGSKISIKNWVVSRDLCTTRECIDISYTNRIFSISEVNHSNDSYYKFCGASAATRCFLKERLYLGVYNESQVILDKVGMIECLRSCSAEWVEYFIYELKNGVRDRDTEWSGRFRDGAFVDYNHLRIQTTPERLSKPIEVVHFGVDKPGCPDCYKITHSIKRTSNGWEENKANKQ